MPRYGGINTVYSPVLELALDFNSSNLKDYYIIWKTQEGGDEWFRVSHNELVTTQKTYFDSYSDRCYLSMYLNENWDNQIVTALGIEFVPESGQRLSVTGGRIDYIRCNYDTRKSNATYQWILSFNHYVQDTNDTDARQALPARWQKRVASHTYKKMPCACSVDGGKTTPAEDGSKEFSAKLDLVSVYNSVVTFLNANMENTIGAALDSIAGQGEKYVEKVIDRLFPATGNSLTIKQFIAALEETLGELGVDFSFKALVDEIQTITGLTTQDIADVINPLLQNLVGGIVRIDPAEGETLYDTLNNGAFKLLTVDGILALIPMGSGEGTGTTEDEGSESTQESLTSAMINKMLKEYAYNEEMTLSAIFEMIELPIDQVLGMLDVQKGEVSFGISFDSENRLTEISISGAIGVYANMPAEEEGETMSVSAFVVDASATLIFEYTVDDSVFALPESVNTNVYDYTGAVDSGTSIPAGEFLVQAGCVTKEVIGKITFYSDSVQFYGIDASGYVSSGDTGYVYDYDTSTERYVIKMVAPSEVAPSEYDYILAICCLEEGNYMIKLPVVTAAQA